MTTAKLGMAGQTPSVKIQPADPNQPRIIKTLSEKEKYTKMWKVDEYRNVSPGELAGQTFLSVAKPSKGDQVIDFGCGTGRGSFYLSFIGGMKSTMLDFAPNCLDDDVKTAMKNFPDKFEFIEHDLTQEPVTYAKYGYCTDVMEHIPEADVDRVLLNILQSARKVFFRISTTPDVMGPKYLNQHLHLSVHDYGWWCAKFCELGATILHSENLDGAVDFYVTAWHKKMPKGISVNTSQDQVIANIKANAKFNCKHVRPHRLQDQEVMILCGGPSLNDFKDEILEKYQAGVKVVTMNGSYQWAIDNGITNVNQCMLDARPFNSRFVEPVRDDCLYFIASQCDPSVFEKLPAERTFYWHCTTSEAAIEAVNESYSEYIMCGGGSTVALRAIVLLRILGFHKQVIYGMDSCVRGDQHHAYEQTENDYKAALVPFMVGDRTFQCQPWMAYQAFEFIDMMKNMGDEFDVTVRGDGLISHIIETGASLPQLEET